MHRIVRSDTPESGNFADLVLRHGAIQPWVTALQVDNEADASISFGEFASRVTRFRKAIRQNGWRTQERIVLMVAPSSFLYVCVVGLLAEGLVPVFIDRGLGRKRMMQALELSGAGEVIANQQAIRVGRLLTLTKRLNWHSEATFDLSSDADRNPINKWETGVTITADQHGLISYTSGTTGRPKGADRTHASLIAQHQAIRSHWQDQPGDIDMTCLPVLVLHNLCCGMPSVLPDMDFAAPAQTDGARVFEQIYQHGVTRISGAPAFISRIAHAAKADASASPLKSVRIGGAPVGSKMARELLNSFSGADVAVVYGSTEAEPIAHQDARTLAEDNGPGYLVGKAVAQTTLIRVDSTTKLTDEASLFDAQVSGETPGEIIVKGEHVLKGYVNDAHATRENKIPASDGEVWHRTGDIAIEDEQGQLRLLGRRSDQVQWRGQLIQPFIIERTLQDHIAFTQAALVQSAYSMQPQLFLALSKLKSEWDSQHIAKQILGEHGLAGIPIQVLGQLPVDARHNSKILRGELRLRCEKRLRA